LHQDGFVKSVKFYSIKKILISAINPSLDVVLCWILGRATSINVRPISIGSDGVIQASEEKPILRRLVLQILLEAEEPPRKVNNLIILALF
jgi:hypothetical protein